MVSDVVRKVGMGWIRKGFEYLVSGIIFFYGKIEFYWIVLRNGLLVIFIF